MNYESAIWMSADKVPNDMALRAAEELRDLGLVKHRRGSNTEKTSPVIRLKTAGMI